NGDFSGISTVIRDPLTGQPFPGNVVPASRISPVARAILNNTALYPLPNRGVSGVSGNFVGPTLTNIHAHQGDLRLDWNGSANANSTFGIPGGQPIAGLSSLVLNSGLTSLGASATDSNTLDKTYQVNEKLTWLKGRHSLKFGGQLLHYVQQRFYAGNNGLLGNFNYGGTFTGFAFSDFLLDQVSSKGRGSASDPWTHLHNRIALFVQDD